ncbi:glutathione S-transferase 1-like [Metopolophium dirhodum]|uniref:glutathione S-transferase 1-like n=1 Tax=Metopolophium dirhodum TaxID=44670 RepID=UPI0029904E01|nr:glutathione S-transferase 1-like [Metopolophium dirhodum]
MNSERALPFSNDQMDTTTLHCRDVLYLYYTSGSAPCRSVLLTAKALGLELNLLTGYIELYPEYTLPTLIQDDFVLCESRAIMVYLVEMYGKDDNTLFPKDTKKRALINQRLQYDLGTLYQTFIDQYYMWFFDDVKKTDEKEMRLHEALGFLETFLKSSDWVAGDSMTLADISLVASISTFEIFDVDLNRYEKVSKWLQRCKTKIVGYEDINQVGIDRFKALVDKKLANTSAQKELVTKDEVLTAIEVLRKAVTAKIIDEEFSESIKKIGTAVSVN